MVEVELAVAEAATTSAPAGIMSEAAPEAGLDPIHLAIKMKHQV
jgi:hypothetical protein